MSRPIKFMAWDKLRQELLPCEKIGLVWNGLWSWSQEAKSGLDINLLNCKPPIYDNRFTLYQFTGLLDKDGKEIYEGHRLDHKYDQVVFWNSIYGRWDVKAGREGYSDTPLWCMNERFKIVGHTTEEG